MTSPTRRSAASAVLLAVIGLATHAEAQPSRIPDGDINDAYDYMLGRWLVLRQEALDLKEGFRWNEIVHRDPVPATAVNPNFDVVVSEAWVGIDETSCTIVDVPEIKDRYYTLQVLNGWGEVSTNINERTFPKHAHGQFALCLKGAVAKLPKTTQRLDLPSRKSHLVLRIALGDNPADAIALQKRVVLKAAGSPRIDKAVVEPAFANTSLPGVETFSRVDDILASEPDTNVGMVGVQDTARAISKAIADPAERTRIDDTIRKQSIPAFLAAISKVGKAVNGWSRPRITGNYRSDYDARTIANFTALWANTSKEMVTYTTAQTIDGSRNYVQSHGADSLPEAKARYSWSVTLTDAADGHVVTNKLNHYTINERTDVDYGDDGSLTLAFGPRLPAGVAETNWLPTTPGKRYNLTYRFYAPMADAAGGTYNPPPLVLKK